MAYGSVVAPGPQLENTELSLHLPYLTTLKDGTPVIFQRLFSPSLLTKNAGKPETLARIKRLLTEKKVAVTYQRQRAHPSELTEAYTNRAMDEPNELYTEAVLDVETYQSAHRLLNFEIKMGYSYPFTDELSEAQFDEYFFAYDTFVVRRLTPAPPAKADVPLTLPDPNFIGCFYIKPNWPGRSAHMCNGGFLVAPAARGRSAGLLMGRHFPLLAAALHYRGSIFNLVFVDNTASLRLWQKLGYTAVGTIPGAGRHPKDLRRQLQRIATLPPTPYPLLPGEKPPTAEDKQQQQQREAKAATAVAAAAAAQGGPSSGSSSTAAHEKKKEEEDEEHYVDAVMWYRNLSKPIVLRALPWETSSL